MTQSVYMSLTRVLPGSTAVIETLGCTPRQFSRLAPLGLVRGAEVTVLRNNMSGLLLEAGQTTIALSREIAASIKVGGKHVAAS